MVIDVNMKLARHFAENLVRMPEYPASLKFMSVEKRAKMLDEIDRSGSCSLIDSWPLDPDPETLFNLFAKIANQLAKIAGLTKEYLPEIPDPLVRINIVLRLWVGCLDTAKTIAVKTLSGPVTPQDRSIGSQYIEGVASADSIYEAGVEAALAFKKRRGDYISFVGVPPGTRVFKLIPKQPGKL